MRLSELCAVNRAGSGQSRGASLSPFDKPGAAGFCPGMTGTTEPFWRVKRLDEMTREEWESLCDGCAKCCLIKLEDEDTGEIEYTDIACRLLDAETCRCTDYANRSVRVPDCVTLTPQNLEDIEWMPPSCAYRLVRDGKDLPWWHPLVSGEYEAVRLAGMSVYGRFLHEDDADMEDLEGRIVDWPLLPPE